MYEGYISHVAKSSQAKVCSDGQVRSYHARPSIEGSEAKPGRLGLGEQRPTTSKLFSMRADENDLGKDDGGHEEKGGKGDGKDLGVEDDEALPGRTGEAAPCVVHGGVALAADDAGLDLALEGAVKGDDSVGLLG